jgi:hypothetical protein
MLPNPYERRSACLHGAQEKETRLTRTIMSGGFMI